MFWFSSAHCYSLPLDTHCISDTSTLNSSSVFWLQFTTSITKHQSYLWILLHLSVKFPLQCLRSGNPNQPSWFYGNWEGGYTKKNLTNLNLKYSNNSFWPQSTEWIFILLMEKGSLLAWYFAAVQLPMPSSAFSVVFSLKKENERMSPVTSGQYRIMPSGHCITGSCRALVFLLTAKLHIKEREGSRCSPYCTGRNVSELLPAHILQLLQRFSGSKKRLEYRNEQKWTESFSDNTLSSDFFFMIR